MVPHGLLPFAMQMAISESPTRPDTYFARQRRPWKARMALRYEIKTSRIDNEGQRYG